MRMVHKVITPLLVLVAITVLFEWVPSSSTADDLLIRPLPPNAPAPDWSSSIDACWTFESSGRLDDVCSSTVNDNLTDGGTATYSSTGGLADFGDYYIADGSSDYLYDADGETTFVISGSGETWSMWCFADSTTAVSSEETIMGKFDGSTDGYNLEIENASGPDYRLLAENKTTITSNNHYSANRWTFVSARNHNGTTNDRPQVRVLYSGSGWVASTVGTPPTYTDPADEFALAVRHQATPDEFFTGHLDNCGFTNQNLNDESLCKICSCGVDGSACTCRQGADEYADSGLNGTICGSCALPACNSSSPTTL